MRALAEHAEQVIAITMYHGLAVGFADLVLPGTSYLERDGTTMNLEGRLQRLRRSIIPPGPDELAWISKLADRFGVTVSPHASLAFAEVSERAFGGHTFGAAGEQAQLPTRTPFEAPPAIAAGAAADQRTGDERFLSNLRLLRYRPLFSGPAVERVPELQFQRPERELELSAEDAGRRSIASGDLVSVRSNGTSVELRARVNRKLVAGVVRVADEHAGDLHREVEVVKA